MTNSTLGPGTAIKTAAARAKAARFAPGGMGGRYQRDGENHHAAGPIEAEAARRLADDAQRRDLTQPPLRRPAQLHEVLEVAVVLLSDYASR